MKPGDVIAFGGKARFSSLIKLITMGNVSHVGTILQTKVVDDNTGRFFNQLIESTLHDDVNGVIISRFSDVIAAYPGDIWWLPIDRTKPFNQEAFFDFLFDQARAKKPYDLAQALKSAVDLIDMFDKNTEDFSKFFCSELVAAGFEKAGLVSHVNASEVTPIDLCRWRIFEDDYYLLKGDSEKEISRHNSTAPVQEII